MAHEGGTSEELNEVLLLGKKLYYDPCGATEKSVDTLYFSLRSRI